MLPYLQEMKDMDYDLFSFMPGDEGDLLIEGGTYVDKGEEVVGTLGNVYHITIFKEKKDETFDFDNFEAVLDPLEYMSHIIPSGFFGFISKKTSTSHDLNIDMVTKIKECLEIA